MASTLNFPNNTAGILRGRDRLSWGVGKKLGASSFLLLLSLRELAVKTRKSQFSFYWIGSSRTSRTLIIVYIEGGLTGGLSGSNSLGTLGTTTHEKWHLSSCLENVPLPRSNVVSRFPLGPLPEYRSSVVSLSGKSQGRMAQRRD